MSNYILVDKTINEDEIISLKEFLKIIRNPVVGNHVEILVVHDAETYLRVDMRCTKGDKPNQKFWEGEIYKTHETIFEFVISNLLKLLDQNNSSENDYLQ